MPFTRAIKVILFLFYLVFAPCFVFSQNLVTDPSFEDNRRCPSRFDDYSALNQWDRVGSGTPDYYNLCGCPGSSSCSNSASNAWNRGNQIPRTGNGMAGFIGYNHYGGLEFVSVHLSEPLEAGEVYEVEYYLSLADAHTSAIYELGLSFHTGSPTTTNHYNSTSLIGPAVGDHVTDKINWVRISGSYTAVGGEDHIMIGASNSDPRSMDRMTVRAGGMSNSMAYYFIDDVSVIKSCSPPDFSLGNDTSICPGQSILLYDSVPELGSPYVWEDGSNVIPRTINSAGTYSLTITNEAGCSRSDTIVVDLGSFPELDLGNDTTVCDGAAIVLHPSLPLIGRVYTWEDGSGVVPRNVSTAGVYVLELTNEYGCSTSDSIIITTYLSPTFNLGNDTSICSGDSILLNHSLFLIGETYIWEDGSSVIPRTINSVGTYKLTVTNAGGCSKSDTVVVDLGSIPELDLGNDTAVCDGSSIILHPSLPLIGSVYIWEDGSSIVPRRVSTAGVYVLELTNEYGCSISDSITISAHSSPAVNLGNDTSICSGDSILLNNSTILIGETYLWEDGSNNNSRTVYSGGTYNLTITSAGGCSKSDTIIVNSITPPIINLGNDTAICEGDSIILHPSLPIVGNDYLWEDGSNVVPRSVSAAGVYVLELTNDYGCSIEDSITIKSNLIPVVSLGNDTSICSDDSLIMMQSPALIGETYVWEDGSTVIPRTINSSGTFSLTVTTSLGCAAKDTISISSSISPDFNLGSDTTFCDSDSVILFNEAVEIGYSYLWDDGSNIVPRIVKTTGEYILTITNSSSCSSKDTINITNVANPTVDLGNDTSICSGDSVSLFLSSPLVGYNYVWDNGSIDIPRTVTTEGVFYLNVTNSNGCSTKDSVFISFATNPVFNLGNDTTMCDGDSTTLMSDSILLDQIYLGSEYTWADGERDMPRVVNSEGTYSLIIYNEYGCSFSDTINISYNPSPEFDLGSNSSICDGDSVSLPEDLGISEDTYLWSDGLTDAFRIVTSPGTYSLQVTNTFGCFKTDTIAIFEKAMPSRGLTSDTTICEGDTISLFQESIIGDTYQWEDGSTLIPRLVSDEGVYVLTITKSNGCFIVDSVLVNNTLKPDFNLGNDTTICSGELLNLLNSTYEPTDDYIWEDGSFEVPRVINSSGTYKLTATTRLGCENTDSIKVSIRPEPTLTLSDTTFCFNQSDDLVLSPKGEAMSSYYWNSLLESSRRNVSVSSPGVYLLDYTDLFGCSGNLSVNVVEDESCKTPIQFPNAFTPNGDGLNDVFSFSKESFEGFELYIYNRWGELIYQGNKSSLFWDGKYQNRDVPIDVYVWVFNYNYLNALGSIETSFKRGQVSVIR